MDLRINNTGILNNTRPTQPTVSYRSSSTSFDSDESTSFSSTIALPGVNPNGLPIQSAPQTFSPLPLVAMFGTAVATAGAVLVGRKVGPVSTKPREIQRENPEQQLDRVPITDLTVGPNQEVVLQRDGTVEVRPTRDQSDEQAVNQTAEAEGTSNQLLVPPSVPEPGNGWFLRRDGELAIWEQRASSSGRPPEAPPGHTVEWETNIWGRNGRWVFKPSRHCPPRVPEGFRPIWVTNRFGFQGHWEVEPIERTTIEITDTASVIVPDPATATVGPDRPLPLSSRFGRLVRDLATITSGRPFTAQIEGLQSALIGRFDRQEQRTDELVRVQESLRRILQDNHTQTMGQLGRLGGELEAVGEQIQTLQLILNGHTGELTEIQGSVSGLQARLQTLQRELQEVQRALVEEFEDIEGVDYSRIQQDARRIVKRQIQTLADSLGPTNDRMVRQIDALTRQVNLLQRRLEEGVAVARSVDGVSEPTPVEESSLVTAVPEPALIEESSSLVTAVPEPAPIEESSAVKTLQQEQQEADAFVSGLLNEGEGGDIDYQTVVLEAMGSGKVPENVINEFWNGDQDYEAAYKNFVNAGYISVPAPEPLPVASVAGPSSGAPVPEPIEEPSAVKTLQQQQKEEEALLSGLLSDIDYKAAVVKAMGDEGRVPKDVINEFWNGDQDYELAYWNFVGAGYIDA